MKKKKLPVPSWQLKLMMRSETLLVSKIQLNSASVIQIVNDNESFTLWLHEAEWLHDQLSEILDGRKVAAQRGDRFDLSGLNAA